MEYPVIFQNLIDSLRKLPGIGSKTAERMAYDILSMSQETIESFANSILAINNISRCPICGNLSENNNLCEICSSEERDNTTICVVHGPKDVFAFEKMKEYALATYNFGNLKSIVREHNLENVLIYRKYFLN